jgi:hypothetical protein
LVLVVAPFRVVDKKPLWGHCQRAEVSQRQGGLYTLVVTEDAQVSTASRVEAGSETKKVAKSPLKPFLKPFGHTVFQQERLRRFLFPQGEIYPVGKSNIETVEDPAGFVTVLTGAELEVYRAEEKKILVALKDADPYVKEEAYLKQEALSYKWAMKGNPLDVTPMVTSPFLFMIDPPLNDATLVVLQLKQAQAILDYEALKAEQEGGASPYPQVRSLVNAASLLQLLPRPVLQKALTTKNDKRFEVALTKLTLNDELPSVAQATSNPSVVSVNSGASQQRQGGLYTLVQQGTDPTTGQTQWVPAPSDAITLGRVLTFLQPTFNTSTADLTKAGAVLFDENIDEGGKGYQLLQDAGHFVTIVTNPEWETYRQGIVKTEAFKNSKNPYTAWLGRFKQKQWVMAWSRLGVPLDVTPIVRNLRLFPVSFFSKTQREQLQRQQAQVILTYEMANSGMPEPLTSAYPKVRPFANVQSLLNFLPLRLLSSLLPNDGALKQQAQQVNDNESLASEFEKKQHQTVKNSIIA